MSDSTRSDAGTNTADSSAVAIVGMACRFPGAGDVGRYWSDLRAGVERIVPLRDETLLAAGVDPSLLADPRYVKAAPLLDGYDRFDAGFFGYSAMEAEIMDPQQRLLLECAWTALEDAGYDPWHDQGAIGVYAGSKTNTYLFHLASNPEVLATWDPLQLILGGDQAMTATRISYKLGLKGPSYGVQSACSSSLVAVHLACQALLLDECRMALAGGVAINVPHDVGYLYQEGGILSPDGHCRPFDAAAAGTVFGSGVGMVVLKRLSDAIADGDRIRALILGSAVNNDGAEKASFTAPGVEGQTDVVVEALACAGVEAESISYVEAHGTGTALGDPIEVLALTQAYRASTDRRGFCTLGSVKGNFGHLDAAAGIASLIKTVLALENAAIPLTLHFQTPHPGIDFDASPFLVTSELTPWQRQDGPRRAGISSLGFGGTNAHLIVQEAPPPEPAEPRPSAQLLVLSARSTAALETATANLAHHLDLHPELELADVASTLQRGRHGFDHRRIAVSNDRHDAIAILDPVDPERVVTGELPDGPRRVLFLFSGQGSQYPDMGLELYREEPVFRREIDRAAEILTPHLDGDLRTMLYPPIGCADGGCVVPPRSPQGDDTPAAETAAAAARLARTELTQPALVAVEHALARLWMSWGIRPWAMIGHSIGEYVAACLAGVFTLEEALPLVAERGRLIAGLPAGDMLAVPLPEDELRAELSDELALAAVNGPRRCVVSGPAAAVAALAERLAERGVGSRPLHTSHAFHSAMMDPILDAFTQRLHQVRLAAPRLRYLSNVTGEWIRDDEATDPAYWARHLRATVRFGDGVATALAEADCIPVEVGPGTSLATFVRERPSQTATLPSLPHPNDRRSAYALILGSLGKLWLAGAKVDWQGLYAGRRRRRRVPLPTYPFEHRRYWIGTAAPATTDRLVKTREIEDWFYRPVWRETEAPEQGREQPDGCWLVLRHASGLGSELGERLARAGAEVWEVTAAEQFARTGDRCYGLRPGVAEDYHALFAELAEQGRKPIRCVHCWNVTAADEIPLTTAQDQGFYSLVFFAQAWVERFGSAALRIDVVSDQIRSITGNEPLQPEKSTLLAPCLVIPQEHPNIACRSIDVDPADAGEERVDRFPGAGSIDEFWQNLCAGRESITFFDDGQLLAAGVDPETLSDPLYVKARPILDDVELFDAGLFGYSPREAEIMDPQHRIFLECAWQALEDAGYDTSRYHGRVGVYAGTGFSSYLQQLHSNPELMRSVDSFQTLIGNDKDALTTRVSYKLDLRGPSIAVQTFCSSSLVAVHMATRALRGGEADMVLAGGVSVIVPQHSGYRYQEGGITSRDGHVRTFDAGASGMIFGNGVGVVVLKRLADALSDGDRIYAVIRGTAVNNDGGLKPGYTAAGIDGQSEVVADALADAGVDPETITYVEAHGTGTGLGDPVEVAALTRAFRSQTAARQFCAVGSVKTNVGHLDRAAGVTGLIKTVLALSHHKLPPSLNFEQPNPEIDFADSPFYVQTELSDWPAASEKPRRAGVTSLGFGGTNAHVVVEEAPAVPAADPDPGPQLLILSAHTADALAAATAKLADFLDEESEIDLADVAFTLQVGRRQLDQRRALVCADVAEAVTLLRSGGPSAGDRPARRRPVFLFPGQGSQYPGMAGELYEREPVFRRELDRCCEVLEPILRIDLREVIELGSDTHGRTQRSAPTATDINQTTITQPVLFAVEYALARMWMAWGVRPTAMIGHSIGEYVAACLAGVFSLEDALALVAARGRMIGELPGGGMLAVPLTAAELEPRLDGGELSLAAVNAPDRVVVSGPAAAIAAFAEKLTADGVDARRLHCSHAFHSAMVEPAVRPFAQRVAEVELRAPRIPFISCLTGTWISDEQATDPEYWGAQLRREVRFSAGMAEPLPPREQGASLDERVHRVRALEQTAEVVVLAADCEDPEALATAVAGIRESCGPIRGVLHAAGPWNGHNAPADELDAAVRTRLLARHAAAVRALEAAVAGDAPEIALLVSPLAAAGGQLPVPCQAADLQCAAVAGRPRPGPGLAWRSIAWDLPVDAGETSGGLPGRLGAAALAAVLARPRLSRLLVTHRPPPDMATAWNRLPRSADVIPATADEIPATADVIPATADEIPATDAMPAATEEQQTVTAIWQEVLGVDRVGLHDDFFELGGDSLIATRVLARIVEEFAVEMPVAKLFELPTIAGQARVVAEIRTAEARCGRITRVDRSGPLPLSFSQQRIWFIDYLESGNLAYNLPGAMRIMGEVSVPALEESLNRVVARHEVLRTRIVAGDEGQHSIGPPSGEPRLEILDTLRMPLPVVDLRALLDNGRRADRLATELNLRPYHLDQAPLLRIYLVRLKAHEHVLLVNIHHSIADTLAISIFLQDMTALYEALVEDRPDPLPALPVQYADFAAWQRRQLDGDALDDQLEYWCRELAGELPVLELPCDRPRPPVQTFRGRRYYLTIPPAITATVDALARRQKTTPFVVTLAAFNLMLHRTTGQTDLLVGVPVAGRRRTELEMLIGLFMNIVVLRADLTGEPTARQLVDRLRERTMAALRHQDLPFERLVDILKPPRDMSRSPIFQVLFNLQTAATEAVERAGVAMTVVDVDSGTARSELEIILWDQDDGLRGYLEYNTDLYDLTTMVRMARSFQEILRELGRDPDVPIRRLLRPAAPEMHQLLAEWNDRRAPELAADTILPLLADAAETHADSAAVVFEDRWLSYRELGRRSDRLAAVLQQRGVGRESVVGICCERCPELVLGLVAILKAGGAYLPLEPEHPAERLRWMVEDAGVRLVLTCGPTPELPAPTLRLDRPPAAAASPRFNMPTSPSGNAAGSTASSSSISLLTGCGSSKEPTSPSSCPRIDRARRSRICAAPECCAPCLRI